jgi:hypothetical protein
VHQVVFSFVNLYMFRAYLDPSSGGTTVFIQQWVLIIIVFRWLSVVLVRLEPIQPGQQTVTKYTKNNLCINLVFLFTSISRCTVNKTYNLADRLVVCGLEPETVNNIIWIFWGFKLLRLSKTIMHSKTYGVVVWCPLNS